MVTPTPPLVPSPAPVSAGTTSKGSTPGSRTRSEEETGPLRWLTSGSVGLLGHPLSRRQAKVWSTQGVVRQFLLTSPGMSGLVFTWRTRVWGTLSGAIVTFTGLLTATIAKSSDNLSINLLNLLLWINFIGFFVLKKWLIDWFRNYCRQNVL